MRDVHPVCFVGWVKNSQHIDYFMETIGVGDWETADCIVVRLLKMILITNNQKLEKIVETFFESGWGEIRASLFFWICRKLDKLP